MPNIDPFDNFDIDDPNLPQLIEEGAMGSGNYPYEKKLKRERYEMQLLDLQRELVKLQKHLQLSNDRLAIVFEGRDSAGKGGSIKTYLQYLNPRHNNIIALPKPTEREREQWYFQRYVNHLPAGGETALFDRSWYNRGGVEPVMGFCTPKQTEIFLNEAPRFEQMLVDDGLHLFKFWLDIGREMQLKRFHDRRHNPLKVWKLSPIDMEALRLWGDYTKARNKMLNATESKHAPWTIIRANDKRRARLNLIRTVLIGMEYEDKDEDRIGERDLEIVLSAEDYLEMRGALD